MPLYFGMEVAKFSPGRPVIRKTILKRCNMNWDQVKGSWKQFKGKVKEKWGKLTDDDLTTIAGQRDQLLGKLQQQYGFSREQAEKEVDDFIRQGSPK